jgi:hypothetical protein
MIHEKAENHNGNVGRELQSTDFGTDTTDQVSIARRCRQAMSSAKPGFHSDRALICRLSEPKLQAGLTLALCARLPNFMIDRRVDVTGGGAQRELFR